ncbi:uncharacterized protein LOC132628341 [Lycium barbarum]|uniref:uncharacterized protein LOC132628341 n=1 Tax=Lycium barbarum TaxID=112863 RepID=UPI00293F2592|nr:uncharacterized protein LOC132628341 [Lycium barbarum]
MGMPSSGGTLGHHLDLSHIWFNHLVKPASSYKIHRQKRSVMPQSKEIWSKGLPFQISFFMWRLTKKELPFDDTLTRFRIQPDTRCICCRVDKKENLNHVFARSDLAIRAWRMASDPLGISYRHSNVTEILKNRWDRKPINVARCTKKYDNKNTSNARIKQKLLFQIKITLGKIFSKMNEDWNWEFVCDIVINYRTRISSKLVQWECPEQYSFILNTGGSCYPSLTRAGAGGIIRKRNGDMVMAFAKPLQFLTNNSSELQATLYGLKWCHFHNLSDFIMQLDSLFVVQMIQGKGKVPWNFQKLIEEMKKIVNQRRVKVSHCYREANLVADALSKLFNNLDQEVVGPLRMDKMGFPSFRIRPAKHTGWYFEPP